MRILFVAMADSVHTARWISQIDDQGWDIHLYPSIDCGTDTFGFKKYYHSPFLLWKTEELQPDC